MKLHQVLKCPHNKRNFKGDLDLNGTLITGLPNNLTVEGWLDLSETEITSLPENLSVGGDLDLCYTGIISLPDTLIVKGSLYLCYNNTSLSLPNKFTVGGDLDLENTLITSLPDDLTVGGDLNLRNTKITELPNNLKIGGELYLERVLLTNYPIVHNWEISHCSIWLTFNNRNLIRISDFIGTQEETIQRIKNSYPDILVPQCIAQVNQCFQMQQDLNKQYEKNTIQFKSPLFKFLHKCFKQLFKGN